MEARVAKLEAAAEHLQVQLGDVKVSVEHSRSLLEQMIDRLARIETDLKHLPTKTTLTWGAVAFFVAMAGAVAGIVALNNS
jgi:uncharacterized coiled-coil protein SlyX